MAFENDSAGRLQEAASLGPWSVGCVRLLRRANGELSRKACVSCTTRG